MVSLVDNSMKSTDMLTPSINSVGAVLTKVNTSIATFESGSRTLFTDINKLTEECKETISSNSGMLESAKDLTSKVNSLQEISNNNISIASQTNLLALNASIEALRAGEVGRRVCCCG